MTTRYVALLAFGLLLASCGNKGGQQAPQDPHLPAFVVPTETLDGVTTYPVSMQGIVNADVRAKISGYITKVLVDEGDYVTAGQKMFRLETNSLSQQAQAAKASVDAAQVGVNQLEPLVKQNIVSPIQLETAKANLAQAKATYKSIVANIGYADIVAPVSGYVGKINYRQGNLVDPTSPLPLTTVSNTNQVFGYFSMNESDYVDFLQRTQGATLGDKMKHFPPVLLQLPNSDTFKHEGRIETVTAQVDPQTGTVSFRAIFPNPEHLIADGSSGTIIIPKTYTNMVVVPLAATFEQQGLSYVFKLLPDNTVTPVIVEIEAKVGSIAVLKSGINAGDKVVASGVGSLQDKMKIVPTMKPFDSVSQAPKTVFQ